jgi:hypothetical protein
MGPEPLTILFSNHAIARLKERLPDGHGLRRGVFVRLIRVRHNGNKLNEQWMLQVPNGILLGTKWRNEKGTHRFIVRTVLDADMVHRRQQKTRRQLIPLEAHMLQIRNIWALGA